MHRKQDVARLTKLEAACNTVLSLLFMLLTVLFMVFVLDLLGVIHLANLMTFVKKGQVEVNTNMPFIISTAQQPATALNTPIIDHKEYRFVHLNNQLKVLLIRDESATMAEASMNVQAGSWAEPDAFPGLAHFCEHMLFEGSTTYPEVGYFDQLVGAQGGYNNAYTEDGNTNYFFTVGESNLLKTLDVFSHFFIDPLFAEQAVAKEISAVNSEYEIDVNGDGWNLMNLFTLLSDKSHPASRFTIGSTATLTKDDVVQALKTFHAEHYSANLMTLAIRSSSELDVLEKWLVQDSDFELIPNKQLLKQSVEGRPLGNNLGCIIKFATNSDTKSIILNYQLAGRQEYVNTKPVEFLDWFVSSSHRDGLKDYLKSQGLIVDMEASTFIEADNFSNYLIELTPMTNIDQTELPFQLAKITNSYFKFLKSQFFDADGEATSLLDDYYGQQSKLAQVTFKYMDESTGTPLADIAYISKSLSQNKPEEVLSADFLMTSYQPSIVGSFLDQLIDTANILILVGDKSYQFEDLEEEPTSDVQFLSSDLLDNHSDLYKMDYAIRRLQDSTLLFIQTEVEETGFSLPPMNRYIPDDSLIMKETCQKSEDGYQAQSQIQFPEQMTDPYNDNSTQVQIMTSFPSQQECIKNEQDYESANSVPQLTNNNWVQLDRSFEVPSVYAAIRIETRPLKTVQDHVGMLLLSQQLQDQFTDELNEALSAGYAVEVKAAPNALNFEMYGYSGKMKQFFTSVVSSPSLKVTLDVDRFTRVKNGLDSTLRDTFEGKLYEQIINHYLPMIMTAPYYTPQEQVRALSGMTLDDLGSFQKDVMKHTKVTSLFLGNILGAETQELSDTLKGLNNDQSLTPPKTQTLDLHGQNVVYALDSLSSDESDPNGATLNYYQVGRRTIKDYAIMKLLTGYFNTQAYEQLRTQQQLGYVVQAGFSPLNCIDGAIVVVQGSTKYPYEVNGLIEKFLKDLNKDLLRMKTSELKTIKEGVLALLLQDTKSLINEGQQLWKHISLGNLAFQEKQMAAEQIRNLKLKDLTDFFDRVFMSDTRGKLSVQLYGKGMMSALGTSLSQGVKRKGLTTKQSLVKKAEQVVFNAAQLTALVNTTYECDHQF